MLTARRLRYRGHGLRASDPSAQAGGAGGGRDVQGHHLPPLPAWTAPAREVKLSLQRQETTQVRISL